MIYTDILKVDGAMLGDINPIPILREIGDKKNIPVSDQFDSIEKNNFGEFSNTRMLPYLEQNSYTRERKSVELQTIILENAYLRVTFLPDYGGRIYSIYNKTKKQELLYKNNVMQPANLSIRNAWFSGGIEWNLGHLGHSCLTCDTIHFGKVVLDSGEEILRLYEFERMQQLYYQIDFYLGEQSEVLLSYTKIINTVDKVKPLYYWANIAVKETLGVRVFSDATDVIYVKPYFDEKGRMVNAFAKGELPYLEGIEGDATYPTNFLRSNEYFYQNNQEKQYPYEAVAYPDGYVFFEMSTQPLNYRKMFCWGRHKGGTTWQNYLSGTENEAYLEVQAGVAPTQLHVGKIQGQSEVAFMQLFGGIWIESTEEQQKIFGELNASSSYVKDCIRATLKDVNLQSSTVFMQDVSSQPITQVLVEGHIYGYLEGKKWMLSQNDSSPTGYMEEWQSLSCIPTMKFASIRYGYEALSLDSLLELYYGITSPEEIPVYSLDCLVPCPMVDLAWEVYYLYAIKMDLKNKTWYQYHLGVMYYENGEIDKAINLFNDILALKAYCVVAITLGSLYQRLKEFDQSLYYMELGISNLSYTSIPNFEKNAVLNYLRLLNEMQLFEKIWDVYVTRIQLGQEITEEICLIVAQSAYELEQWETLDAFFDLNLERIREGDNTLVEIWYKRQVKKGVVESLEQAKKTLIAPENIDFRML